MCLEKTVEHHDSVCQNSGNLVSRLCALLPESTHFAAQFHLLFLRFGPAKLPGKTDRNHPRPCRFEAFASVFSAALADATFLLTSLSGFSSFGFASSASASFASFALVFALAFALALTDLARRRSQKSRFFCSFRDPTRAVAYSIARQDSPRVPQE